MTFREYIEDMLTPERKEKCDCSAPDPCPGCHKFDIGGQGLGLDTARLIATRAAKMFPDAPKTTREIHELFNAVKREILTEMRTG